MEAVHLLHAVSEMYIRLTPTGKARHGFRDDVPWPIVASGLLVCRRIAKLARHFFPVL